MTRKLYDKCLVCNRPLKSRESRERGAGSSCCIHSFERSLTTHEQFVVLESFKVKRLEELKKKAKIKKRMLNKN